MIDAQARERRRVAQPVDVLGRLAGTTRVRTDRRIDNEHADIAVREAPAIEEPPRKIDDADTVGLANWAERAFPYADPARMRDKAELGAQRPQLSILFFDRQWRHCVSVTPRTAPRRGPRRGRDRQRPKGRDAAVAQNVNSPAGIVVVVVLARVLAHRLTGRTLAKQILKDALHLG